MALPHQPRVLVTRAAGGGSELADRLRALGADPILIPAIEIAAPGSYASLDAALSSLNHFHWLLFTSANAVEAFAARQEVLHGTAIGVPHRRDGLIVAKAGELTHHHQPRVAAIGPATARALEKIGLTPDLLPPQAIAESLTEALLPHASQPDGTPTRFLLIRAEEAREHLPETLRAAGAEVAVAPAYRTVVPATSIATLRDLLTTRVPHLRDGLIVAKVGAKSQHHEPKYEEPQNQDPPNPIAAITFTSSSTARNLLTLCAQAGVTLPPRALRISIGPITSATLHELGLPAHAEAPEATVVSLAQTVIEALAHH